MKFKKLLFLTFFLFLFSCEKESTDTNKVSEELTGKLKEEDYVKLHY